MKDTTLILALLLCFSLSAQNHSHTGSGAIFFPDIPGYKTLKADLHQHTVFSDGYVWPTIRVMEALRDSLDVISLTEHLEYQPHKVDIPHPDRNRSYELALQEAKEHDLMIINGSEITRSAPVGHSNAVFITDANELLHDKPEDAFSAAREQGAFVFWNHPAWYPQSETGNPILSDFQKERMKNGELHGIEVINMVDYSEEALALALEHNLTIMATSDIHGLIDWDYHEKGHARPVTLVFAKERSVESLKEALFAGRTVATYDNLLVGKEEFLNPLIKASVEIMKVGYIGNTSVLEVKLKNSSSNKLIFENAMDFSFYNHSPVFEIESGETITLQIKTLEKRKHIDLKLKALKAYSAPKKQQVVDWKIPIE
ncbi:Sb-PDE family phosphodiesterase [Allomuricauda sp. SCSIO 65647]|uniref:Sb-PDE family phosphodiesterase n=1 Tax=Allomuricauda sp. SCSIO 65647 TaxID=2908843 RepID=UPI001F3D57CF|nr:Sb-PDE family phosphodiesterase [Muricauda sp. SCSIO 65647]UJH66672.1 Sb-PDE family phosphodiesterase [Muricauda sp. SCSIO 65647]